MNRRSNKAFTILELLVVVAIIAIIAVIALPNFIGQIDKARASQELAEINAVTKAINTYYADNGNYPTLQGKDGSLLQAQPLEGAPHNIDFSSLVPDYLASLPHFSYWWVDYLGEVYHTEKPVGSLSGTTFTPTAGYTYTLYKTNGAIQALSAPYTLLAGEYIIGADESGSEIPKIGLAFKNAKMHPEDPEYVASIPVTGVSLNKPTTTITQGSSETLIVSVAPSDATDKTLIWSSSNAAVATVSNSGLVAGISSGSATITVKSGDGTKTATCSVTVQPAFTGATFTNAGATGNAGPTQSQVTTAYTGTSLAGKVTVSGAGIQLWSVPVSGTYRIETYGAQGGGTLGGSGAVMKGDFSLTAGTQLKILVGQVGLGGDSGNGGGGGTFVAKSDNTPLIVSGGGGGAGSAALCRNASLTTSGVAAPAGSFLSGVAGTNGSGSTIDYPHLSGAGGFIGNGSSGTYSTGGYSFINGGRGGTGEWAGGFGGGGGSHANGYARHGGGGGYSGGASVLNATTTSAGGGGSYNIGTNQTNSVGNTGNGKVIITYVGP